MSAGEGSGARGRDIPELPDVTRLERAARSAIVDGHRLRDWSMYCTASRRFRIGTKDGRTAGAHAPASITERAAARYLLVWDDGRVSRGAFERDQIVGDTDAALRDARTAAIEDPDAAHVLGPASFPDVKLCADAVVELASGLVPRRAATPLIELARTARFHRASSWSGSIGASVVTTRLLTSAGLDVCGLGTSYGWGASLGGRASDGFASRSLDLQESIRARLDRLGDRFDALGETAEPPPRRCQPIVLHPRVVESFVLPALFHHLAGSSVHHGESAFSPDDFGSDRVALRGDLTLRVDPLVALRSGSYRFSSEGVPASRFTFVDRGRLISPVLDVKYSRRMGRPPTPLPVAWDAVVLEGPPVLDEDAARASSEATVFSVLGVHTQDFASGDFSLSAPLVLRHRPGGASGRIRGTLAGNLFDVLRSDDLALVRFVGESTPGLRATCRLDAERA
jgi:PmbA protein